MDDALDATRRTSVIVALLSRRFAIPCVADCINDASRSTKSVMAEGLSVESKAASSKSSSTFISFSCRLSSKLTGGSMMYVERGRR